MLENSVRSDVLSTRVTVGMSCGDKPFKERVGLVWFAVKLRMKLAGDKEGMICEFDDFNQFTIRRETAEDKVGLLEAFAVSIVELIPVAMTFVDDKSAVKPGGFGADDQLARLGS